MIPPMTVRELIGRLQMLPQDAVVCVVHADFGYGDDLPTCITGVEGAKLSIDQAEYLGDDGEEQIPESFVAIHVVAKCRPELPMGEAERSNPDDDRSGTGPS